MTVTTNARIAGSTFLIYIAAGIASLILAGNAPAIAVLSMVTSFSALVLGVTLYAITREQDRDLAMLGLTCRVIEAVPGHGEIYFAVASAVFSSLLLRGRMIPVALAWLGVTASVAARHAPSSASRRIVRRPQGLVVTSHLGRVVATVGVRTGARAVVPDKGRRHARAEATDILSC